MTPKELTDDAPFHDMTIQPKADGIEVKLGSARSVLLNRDDAQFLCDVLYMILDEMDLEEQEVLEEGDKDAN